MSHVDDGTLHAYLDGELTPVERARLDAHVAECAACRTRLDEERALIERASGLLNLAQPPERSAPPLHQLRRPRLAWRLRVPLAWAATVVLALGLGYYAGGLGSARLASAPPAALAARDSVTFAPASAQDTQTHFLATPRRDVATRHSAAPAEEKRAEREHEPVVHIDGAVVKSATDSIAASSGVIAIRPQDIRPSAARAGAPTAQAAPAPAMPEGIVVGPRDAAASTLGRSVTTEWPVIRRDPARQILGADPVGIPGLAVRNIRRSPTNDVVLVEQAIDSGTVIQLFQERAVDDQRSSEYRYGAAPRLLKTRSATERLAKFIGGVRVEISGPLSVDSLNRLLEQVKPIRP